MIKVLGLDFAINTQTKIMENMEIEESAKLTEIKFRLVNPETPLILVPIYINGNGPYEFILDTGASHSIISDELAKILNIKGNNTEEAMGWDVHVELISGEIDSFGIGIAILEKQEISIGTSEDLENAVGEKINGIVGYDYLKNFIITIDYPRSIITIGLSPK